MALKILQRMIDSILQLLSDCPQIHGPFDDLEVIRQSEFNGVDRTVENPSMLMALQGLENVQALRLQFLGR